MDQEEQQLHVPLFNAAMMSFADRYKVRQDLRSVMLVRHTPSLAGFWVIMGLALLAAVVIQLAQPVPWIFKAALGAMVLAALLGLGWKMRWLRTKREERVVLTWDGDTGLLTLPESGWSIAAQELDCLFFRRVSWEPHSQRGAVEASFDALYARVGELNIPLIVTKGQGLQKAARSLAEIAGLRFVPPSYPYTEQCVLAG